MEGPEGFWSVWYVLPQVMPDSKGRVSRVVLALHQVGAKLHRSDTDESDRILMGEVCTEGSGGTLQEFEPQEVSAEGATALAQQLVTWAKTNLDGTGVTTYKKQQVKVSMINILSEEFLASGLNGTLYPHDNENMTDVCYCLPVGDITVVLSVSINKMSTNPLIAADACNEKTGETLFKLPLKPVTDSNLRELVQDLVKWVKSQNNS